MMDRQEAKMISQIMIEGKRTKRPRPSSPVALELVTSNVGDDHDHQQYEIMNKIDVEICDSNKVEERDVEEEEKEEIDNEEELAHCLILLAQGGIHREKSTCNVCEIRSAAHVSLFDGFQCKTCNRCFPSFQALGGHRASHNKPNKVSSINNIKEEPCHLDCTTGSTMSTILSLRIGDQNRNNSNNKKGLCGSDGYDRFKPDKVHRCSICGAEFASGQALGGHMRRHRAMFASNSNATSLSTTTNTMSLGARSCDESAKKAKNDTLDLDLNLPATEDDHTIDSSKILNFGQAREQVLVFSASRRHLVHCHY